jgi:hypothetical protein
MGEIIETLAAQFKEMFGNRGAEAFHLEWAFAQYIDNCLVEREALWIEQAYDILCAKGHDEKNPYALKDGPAFIFNIGVGKSVTFSDQNSNYIFTVVTDEKGIASYHHYEKLMAEGDARITTTLLNSLRSYMVPKVHIRRFYEKKHKDFKQERKDTDESRTNRYPQKPLLNSMYKSKPAYQYFDCRDTGYVWSTGDTTPKLYEFDEVKNACGCLNSLLTCLSEDYDIPVDFHFVKGTVK